MRWATFAAAQKHLGARKAFRGQAMAGHKRVLSAGERDLLLTMRAEGASARDGEDARFVGRMGGHAIGRS